MHSFIPSTHPVAIHHLAPAPLVPEDRPSGVRTSAKQADRARLEQRATRGIAAYFARSHAGTAKSADDQAVEAILRSIPAHHRGALALHHAPRVWPEAVTKAFGPYATLAIRLFCADHPATGSTPALEKAAAERVAAIVAAEGTSALTLLDLSNRAERHHRRALRAYAKRLAATATNPR